jgi:hypothetical protein
VIDYSDIRTDRNTGERSGYVGILVNRELPMTGNVTYSGVHQGTFWPRSLELDSGPSNLTELIGD